MQQFKPPRLRLNDKVTDNPIFHYGWAPDPNQPAIPEKCDPEPILHKRALKKHKPYKI